LAERGFLQQNTDDDWELVEADEDQGRRDYQRKKPKLNAKDL
jgi:hypothetical protein